MLKNNLFYLSVFFVIMLFLTACEESSTEVIEQPLVQFVVTGISAPDKFILSESDSSFVASVTIENPQNLSDVWFNVSTADGLTRIETNVKMADNGNEINGDETEGDGIFSGKTFLGKDTKSGKYQVEFYIADKINPQPDNIHKIGIKYFEVEGGKQNSPPQIVNLAIPDTVSRNQKFTFSAEVKDSNGLQDIREVYYELFNPNGEKVVNSKGISQFPLFDDGDVNANGDETAGDGIYTVFLTIPTNQPTGFWEFKFTAVDKSDAKSNQVSRSVYVK